MKKLSYLVLIILYAFNAFCQPHNLSSGQLLHQAQKLKVVGSVLYIAAHPDDENTRLLSYLANEQKVKTTYLSLTRGDGGQNLIGKEQGASLGLIRTNELLAARKVDGAQQLFTRANDFGYSKNPEETFSIWNKDSVLYDVVLAIRKVKPDLIICRFPITGEGGHGHHTASALLALEAFKKAADGQAFPDQPYSPWQAKSIYWNAFAPDDPKDIKPEYLKLDIGVYNPILGRSYGEMAAESRSNHKSQGFGSAASRGKRWEYFKYYGGDSAITNIFENINWNWDRLGKNKVTKLIDNCLQNWQMLEPYKNVPALINIKKEIEKLTSIEAIASFYKQEKLSAINDLIIQCSGIWLEAIAENYITVPNDSLKITAQVLSRYSNQNITWQKFSLNNFDTTLQIVLPDNEVKNLKHTQVLTKGTTSNPYWLEAPSKNGLFTVLDKTQLLQPTNTNNLKAIFTLNILGEFFSVSKDIIYKYTDPVRGEVYRPIEILPAVTININQKILMVSNTDSTYTLKATIKANTNNVEGLVQLSALNENWEISMPNNKYKISKKGEELELPIYIKQKAGATNYTLALQASSNTLSPNQSIDRINYEHIPAQFILSPAKVKLVPANIKIANKKLGYIIGAGDEVGACLAQIGYNITYIEAKDVAQTNLANFDAIVCGIRAFNTNEQLFLQQQKINEYIKQGGNFIVQYNTNNWAGPIKDKFGPYAFSISRDRVTNENAPMAFINNPKCANEPNKILPEDFEGWVQERGIYFAKDIDNHFVKVLQTNDPNEAPLDGSLIIAPYGKGNFIYTGLAFFRQLPAGVTGAYKLFANLISLPKNE